MANDTRNLDQILDEVLAGTGVQSAAGVQAATAGVEALAADFCQYWPYIKKFLEWAKGQTGNIFAKLIIEGLIKLGDAKCG